MMNRKTVADAIDAYDDEAKQAQESKSETFTAYREQLATQGMTKPQIKTEIEALKAAIRKRRALASDPDAVLEKEDLTDSILSEIRTGTASALARVTREDRAVA